MLDEAVRTILQPAVTALAEQGLEYRGVLYAGLMLTAQGLRAIEFNARFGDPEAQVVLPLLESDLVALMLTCARGELAFFPAPRWSRGAAVGIVIASGGYPDSYETGMVIEGLTSIPSGVIVFHGATRYVAVGRQKGVQLGRAIEGRLTRRVA